jgi:hypothetical protein
VWEDVAASFADLAVLAARVDEPERAARLFGAADALREEAGRTPVNLPERAAFEEAEERARTALGAAAFARAHAEGWARPRERAVKEAAALADEIARAGSQNDVAKESAPGTCGAPTRTAARGMRLTYGLGCIR